MKDLLLDHLMAEMNRLEILNKRALDMDRDSQVVVLVWVGAEIKRVQETLTNLRKL